MISKDWKGILAIAIGVCSPTVSARAQASVFVGVNGVAFDSLRSGPLAGATINLSGLGVSKSATSDPKGRFVFDSIVPGNYTLVMYHASLDSIGLAGISRAAVVKDGAESLQIATPSFSTLWRAACGSAAVPRDSGFVFGAIREIEHDAAAANATVSLSWLQLAVDSSRIRAKDRSANRSLSFTQQRWGGDVHADAHGNYAVCGVPTDLPLQVAATSGTEVTGLLDLAPLDQHSRIRRQDLLLGAATDSGALKPTGIVAGRVQRGSGEAISGARVVVDGATEVRSGSDGRFVVSKVPLGTRQLEVLSVGAVPFIAAVDVIAKDTATVDVNLQTITALAPVKITARSARERRLEEIEARVAQGFGHYADSTRIGLQSNIVNAIAMIDTPKDICAVILDGVKYFERDMLQELKFRSPQDIALIEVYRWDNTPAQYRDKRCGNKYAIVWTKLNIR